MPAALKAESSLSAETLPEPRSEFRKVFLRWEKAA